MKDCHKVCYFCKEYKTVKEMAKNCETYKKRSREIRCASYKAKKQRLANGETTT